MSFFRPNATAQRLQYNFYMHWETKTFRTPFTVVVWNQTHEISGMPVFPIPNSILGKGILYVGEGMQMCIFPST